MAANMEILPITVFQGDRNGDKTEHFQWYGTGKLHPTHLGDTLNNGRYTIVHKLDHDTQSLSWLARDNHTDTWRRIAISHASPDVREAETRTINAHLAERASLGDAAADAQGLTLDAFLHHGPNGTHVCRVFPLQGYMGCFRWEAHDECRMDERWFVRQCTRLRAESGRKGPDSVHEITEAEMMQILGRPQVIMVDDKFRSTMAVYPEIRPEQLPRYLVVRPERIGYDIDFWLSPEAFEQ
jgi:hypothetical protein